VQIDPIKPTLKAPGTKPSKLKYDKPLSSFAFNVNLRRYNLEAMSHSNIIVRLAMKTKYVFKISFFAARPDRPLFPRPTPGSPPAQGDSHIDVMIPTSFRSRASAALTLHWQLKMALPLAGFGFRV
jgi:hypothetical protein